MGVSRAETAEREQTSEMVDPTTRLLTIDDVLSDWLPITRRHLMRMIAAGDIETVRVGRRVFITQAEIRRITKQRKPRRGQVR